MLALANDLRLDDLVGNRARAWHFGVDPLKLREDIEPLGNAAKAGVLSVQVRHRAEAEEELRAAGVGLGLLGHAQRAAEVTAIVLATELVVDRIAGPAGAVPL